MFPRTLVGGVSLPRMLIGTNWFLGFSHTSLAKDRFIREFQTRERIADTLEVFLKAGIDAVMGMPTPLLREAADDANSAPAASCCPSSPRSSTSVPAERRTRNRRRCSTFVANTARFFACRTKP